MKLRNKKTGEIKELPDGFFCGDNLKKICEEWEDYEKPKEREYWYISDTGDVYGFNDDFVGSKVEESNREIGNLFESKEEAEKAVEKLKAVKRLKDKGFRFDAWKNDKEKYLGDFVIFAHTKDLTNIKDDLDLLFGGEE